LGDAAQGGLGVYRGAPGSAGHAQEPGKTLRPSPLNGFWRDADWIGCRDGRWRPVEPGTFPLASGVAARVGRLRGYGDALCAPAAQAFIETVMEVIA
jgi:DNA (cytosine-5)-methyltransferase 1